MPESKEKQLEHAVDELKTAGLDTPDNRARLEYIIAADTDNRGHLEGVTAAIKQLNRTERLTEQKNVDFIFNHPQYGYKISWHIESLINAKPDDLVTQDNLEKMLPHACESYMFSNLFNCLNRLTHLNLATQKNFDQMIRYSYSSDPICGVLQNLTGSGLGIQENLDLIFSHAEHADKICSVTNFLANDHKKLLNQKNFEAIIGSAPHCSGFWSLLIRLNWIGLVNQTNFNHMIDNAPFAKNLARAVESLHTHTQKVSEGQRKHFFLFNPNAFAFGQDKINLLFENAQHANILAQAFDKLSASSQLTEKTFKRLIRNADRAGDIAIALAGDEIPAPVPEEKSMESEQQKAWCKFFAVASKLVHGIDTLRTEQALAARKTQ